MDNDFLCPKLLAAKSDEKYNLSSIFNVAAGKRAKYRKMFEHTHTPIILFDNKGEEVSEEDIFSLFDINYPGNQCTVIEGETGTGKSEICVSLVYMLKDNGWEVVHIHKNMDLPSMITRLLEFYSHLTGKQFPKGSNFDELKRTLINPNKRHAISKIVVGKFFDSEVFTERNISERRQSFTKDEKQTLDEFEKIFSEKMGSIIRTQQLTDYQTEFLTKADVKKSRSIERVIELLIQNSSKKDTEKERSIDSLLEIINSKLWFYLNEHFDTPKLDDVMDEISKEMKARNKRIAMIIEDLKIAAMDLKKLLRYIERDIADDRWDFIIAGTTDIINIVKESATRRDRFHFYRTNPRDGEKRYYVKFLDEKNAVDFALKYFSFLFEQFGHECKTCNVCKLEKTRLYFPYSESFLINLFSHLDDKKPRTYIQTLFYGIQHYLRTSRSPTESSEIKNMKKPYLELEYYIHEEYINRFISFYHKEISTNDRKHYLIPEDYFKIFGINVDSIYGFQKDGNNIKIAGKTSIKTIKSESIFISDEKKLVESKIGIIDQLREKFKEQMDLAYPWIAATTHQLENKYNKVNTFFKIGLKEIMRIFTDDFSLYADSSINYLYGKHDYPFIHRNETKKDNLLQREIDPQSFPESLIREIILLGGAIDDRTSLDIEQKLNLVREGIAIFTNLAIFWRQDFNNHVFEQLSQLLGKKGTEGNILEEIISAFTSFALKLAYPQIRMKPNQIYTIISTKEGNSQFEELLKENCPKIINEKEISNIQKNAVLLFRFYSQFMLENANVQFSLDYSNILENPKVDKIIKKIKKVGISFLDKKLIFERIPLASLLLPIKHAHMKISSYKKTENIDKKEFLLLDENLSLENAEKILSVINENSLIIDKINPILREKIFDIKNFFENPNITDIIIFLKKVRKLIFIPTIEEIQTGQFIPMKDFPLEEFLFWLWFNDHKAKTAMLYFIKKHKIESIDEIQFILNKIKETSGEIINVIDRIT